MANYSEKKEFKVPKTWMGMIDDFICRDGIELCLPGDPVSAGKDSTGIPMVLISLEGSAHALWDFGQKIVKNNY